MTLNSNPVFTQAPVTQHLVLVGAHSTRFRPIWRPDLSGALAAANGANLHKIMVASSDAGANEVQLGIGKPITLQANMGVGSFVDGGGGSDTITRSSGSFVTDGWQVGDRIQALGATTLANDFDAILTAVAALTLTFATATVSTAEAFPTGCMLLRLAQLWRKTIAINAGTIAATVPVSMLDNATQAALDAAPKRYLDLGADDYLFAKATTLLGASETMDIVTEGRAY